MAKRNSNQKLTTEELLVHKLKSIFLGVPLAQHIMSKIVIAGELLYKSFHRIC
ncbi:hypothetical protein [Paenibacillus chitinolyticus]|uniref:hypothetical protein n=1 Tax=Paenibacillus chitinolyticus TaxID=79263 RepID=UPI003670ACE5